MFANGDLSGTLKKVQARALNVEPIGQLLTSGVAWRVQGENFLALEQTSGGPTKPCLFRVGVFAEV